MPTNLTNEPINATFNQLLHVDGGVTGALKIINDGDGTGTDCRISSTTFACGNISLVSNSIVPLNFNGNINLLPPGTGTVNFSKANITGGAVSNVTLTDVGTTSIEGAAFTKTESVSSSAGTLTVDCDESNVFTTTLTENVTVVLNNAVNGQTINILFTQDGTGSRTASWPASFYWAGGAAASLSTGAGEVDLLTASRIGSNWYATLIKDFS